jgi:nucleotide-binding universal stress UspA family protein
MNAVASKSHAERNSAYGGIAAHDREKREPIVALLDRPSTPAAATAISIAGRLELPIVFVVWRRRQLSVLGEPFYQRRLSASTALARNVLEAALREAAQAGVEAEGEILQRARGVSIVEFARARGASFVVVGCRERKLGKLCCGLPRVLYLARSSPIHRFGSARR